jgi:glycosyltransferase involved in cell wall biosynthesis
VAPVDPRRFALPEVAAELGRWCEPRLVPARPAGRLASALRALGRDAPLSIVRHSLAAVRREVERLVARDRIDLLHAEQLQALPQAAPGRRRGLPVVLRAQNVESDLWAAAGSGRLLAAEARRLAAWEGRAVAAADLTLAVSAADAERLARLAAPGGGGEARVRGAGPAGVAVEVGSGPGGPRVEVLPPPFPERLEPPGAALPGAPAVVLLGSAGWPPNRDAAAWFLAEVWPSVRRALPAARLHIFGGAEAAPPGGSDRGDGGDGGEEGIHRHPPPGDSAIAFARGSIHAVPLRFGSGVRMKVLEAWARGVPVAATPEAVAGLAPEDGREVLVAHGAADFAAAISRLHHEPALAETLVEGGRRALRQRHDPGQAARRLLAAYEGVLARRVADDRRLPRPRARR